LDVRQLQYFVRVVELGSLTKAAEQIRIAQPALGLQIRKIEEELGVQLLVRHSRGVEPTEAGRLLMEHAQEILQRVAAARQALRDFKGPPRGRIVLGMTPSVNFMLSPTLIKRSSADLPLVSVNIVEELSAVLIEWVVAGRLDLAFAYRTQSANGLVFEPLTQEDLFFVSPLDPAIDSNRPIAFAEVVRHPLIMPGLPHGLRQLLDEHAAAAGLDIQVALEMQSVAAVRELVEQGVGDTILPFGAVRRYAMEGRLVARKIVEPSISRPLFLVYSDRRPLSKAEQALQSLIRELVAEEVSKADGIWYPFGHPHR
jgi:LysR family transcriptional regulator, nitrogen assimilation regulatory protein